MRARIWLWLLPMAMVVMAQTPSALEQGQTYFKAGEYEKAIAPLRKALDSEKQDSKLTGSEWRLLVDHLAAAYRGVGKLTLAEEVLQYGMAKDPKCAAFDYTMGAIYGDWNKVYISIKWLKLALENAGAGEALPNPRQEQTFERFMKNDDFRVVLREFDARR